MPDAATTLSQALQFALIAIHDTTEGMTDDQLLWHPVGKWSSAEILEHLSLAYTRTADRLEELLQKDLPEPRRRTFREWMGGIIVLRLGHIPSGREAPEALVPKGMTPAKARSCIEEKLTQLDTMIDRCEKRFGSKRNIMDHPALGPLSPSEWRRFHCVHTLHHMRQIKKNREAAAI